VAVAPKARAAGPGGGPAPRRPGSDAGRWLPKPGRSAGGRPGPRPHRTQNIPARVKQDNRTLNDATKVVRRQPDLLAGARNRPAGPS